MIDSRDGVVHRTAFSNTFAAGVGTIEGRSHGSLLCNAQRGYVQQPRPGVRRSLEGAVRRRRLGKDAESGGGGNNDRQDNLVGEANGGLICTANEQKKQNV